MDRLTQHGVIRLHANARNLACPEPRDGIETGSLATQQTLRAAHAHRLCWYSCRCWSEIAFSLPMFLALGGCASHGAQSFALFGAYFPAWMFCALIGIAIALLARATFIIVGLNAILAFRLFTYVSIGVIVAALCWLFWFGPSI
jgi:YtcA family